MVLVLLSLSRLLDFACTHTDADADAIRWTLLDDQASVDFVL